MRQMQLLAIDPGVSTGWSLWRYSDTEPLEHLDHGTVHGGLHGFIDWWVSTQSGAHGREVVAEDFILDKEDGYQFGIAQGGANVSGGQRQRLSIARALATDAEAIIFDDSFSALDYKTDSALRAQLKKEVNNTVLIVAQRISTIKTAEKIIVLNEGKIAGQGTHEELMRSCSVYQEIASSQMTKEELA